MAAILKFKMAAPRVEFQLPRENLLTQKTYFVIKIDLISCLEVKIYVKNWLYMVAILKSKMAATNYCSDIFYTQTQYHIK